MTRNIKYAVYGFAIFWAVVLSIVTFAAQRWVPLSEWDALGRGYIMFCALVVGFGAYTYPKKDKS